MEGYKRYLLPLFLSISFLPGAAAKSQSDDFVARFDCLMKQYKKYCVQSNSNLLVKSQDLVHRFNRDLLDGPKEFIDLIRDHKEVGQDLYELTDYLLDGPYLEKECTDFMRDLQKSDKNIHWLCKQWLIKKGLKLIGPLRKSLKCDLLAFQNRALQEWCAYIGAKNQVPEVSFYYKKGVKKSSYDTPENRKKIQQIIQQTLGKYPCDIVVCFHRRYCALFSGKKKVKAVIGIDAREFNIVALLHELMHLYFYDPLNIPNILISLDVEVSHFATIEFRRFQEWRADVYALLCVDPFSIKQNFIRFFRLLVDKPACIEAAKRAIYDPFAGKSHPQHSSRVALYGIFYKLRKAEWVLSQEA